MHASSPPIPPLSPVITIPPAVSHIWKSFARLFSLQHSPMHWRLVSRSRPTKITPAISLSRPHPDSSPRPLHPCFCRHCACGAIVGVASELVFHRNIHTVAHRYIEFSGEECPAILLPCARTHTN